MNKIQAHATYICSLLAEKKILLRKSRPPTYQDIIVYTDSKRTSCEVLRIIPLINMSPTTEDDKDEIIVRFLASEFTYPADDISNPNAYKWLVELVYHFVEAWKIHMKFNTE